MTGPPDLLYHGYQTDLKGKQPPDEAMQEALQGHLDKFHVPADIAVICPADGAEYTPVDGVRFWPASWMPRGRIYAGDMRSARWESR
jgi:hypothetical protein